MKKHLFLAALILTAATLSAADPGTVTQQKAKAAIAAEKPLRPRPPRRPPLSREEFLRGPGIWRAFAMMSAEEQKEMRKLQRTEPEKYQALMRKKAEELFNAEQLRRKQIAEIVEKYHASTDNAEKENLKNELRNIVKERFDNQLRAMRGDLERTRARVTRLEKELKKRETNSDAIIDAMLKRHLEANPKNAARSDIKAGHKKQ